MFPEFPPDTSCYLFKLLGAEFAQECFGELLGEASGTVIPDRSLLAYLRRPDRGVAFQIVGAPVGFVGAAESCAALAARNDLEFITVTGRRGGSAITAAALNALASPVE